MKKKSLISIFFLVIIMILISIISFSDIFKLSDIDFKGLSIISMVCIFPLLFLIQGIVCVFTNTNIVIPLLVSMCTYIPIMYIFMEGIEIVYVLYYLILFFVGFLISKLIKKFKNKN